MVSHTARSSYLKDSGFSDSKKRTLVTTLIFLWTAVALVLGFCLLLMSVFGGEYPRETFQFLIMPLIIAFLLVGIAFAIRSHIKDAALDNRKPKGAHGVNILEAMGSTMLTPWTTKKGIELYPEFYKQDGHNFILMLPVKPPEFPEHGEIKWEFEVIASMEWDPKSGVIQNIEVKKSEEDDWRRQGIATFLYDKARNVTPHLRHNEALTEDAREWVKSLD